MLMRHTYKQLVIHIALFLAVTFGIHFTATLEASRLIDPDTIMAAAALTTLRPVAKVR